ncbi:hypothetical protein BT69DRAFT_684425 [Atractiella rhizophila]|nr:hypothetical protein BT69DRAFT_684425 [Atractiella rhizophila]
MSCSSFPAFLSPTFSTSFISSKDDEDEDENPAVHAKCLHSPNPSTNSTTSAASGKTIFFPLPLLSMHTETNPLQSIILLLNVFHPPSDGAQECQYLKPSFASLKIPQRILSNAFSPLAFSSSLLHIDSAKLGKSLVLNMLKALSLTPKPIPNPDSAPPPTPNPERSLFKSLYRPTPDGRREVSLRRPNWVEKRREREADRQSLETREQERREERWPTKIRWGYSAGPSRWVRMRVRTS